MRHRSAVILLLITSVLWSLGGVLIKSVEWPSLAKSGARSFFAALMLLVDHEAPRPLVIGNLVVHLALGACLFGAGAFAMLASATGIGR